MASNRGGKNRLVAQLVSEDYGPCAFCQRTVNDEVGYGKLYSIGDIYCHYFCVLLSCCLVQKGEDEEGLLGFLYTDILAEVERSKKHKCSFCGAGGATLGCAVSQCRKQFHLPCGRQRNSLSLFYGTYKSFCEKHAPRQQIPEGIMSNVRARQTAARKRERALKSCDSAAVENGAAAECVCVICYEPVAGFPSPGTFWPPCCARDAWFHRTCLERMSLSAGVHYFKCPLCNDKDTFYRAVTQQGYYVPDRDAAWELENAFADIYSRPVTCTVADCTCPNGREHDMENGPWDIKLCLLCGGAGSHLACLPTDCRYWVCETCQPATPSDLSDLEQKIAALIREEEAAAVRALNSRPLMPSRMSIRRTKTHANAQNRASSSRAQISSPMVHRIEPNRQEPQTTEIKTDVISSRLELNLKTPKKPLKLVDPNILAGIENKLLSPLKYLEEKLSERLLSLSPLKYLEEKLSERLLSLSPLKYLEEKLSERLLSLSPLEVDVDSRRVVDRLRIKFEKPRPLCAKKKIINAILSELLGDVLTPTKLKKLKMGSPAKDNGELETAEETVADKSTTSPKKEITTTPKKDTPTTPHQDTTVTPNKNTQTLPNEEKTATNSDPETKGDEIITNIMDRLDFESPLAIDESSSSTFQLPSEFIAESDDSLPIVDTPKKSTTVEIQKNSSLEISEDNEAVNIDVVKIETGTSIITPEVLKNLLVISPLKNRSKFAYIPCNKEADYKTVGIDLEDFKNQYLNELEKKHQCGFNHKHEDLETRNFKLKSAIDFALDAAFNKTTNSIEPVLKEEVLKENTNEKEPLATKKRKAIDKQPQNIKKRKLSRKKKDKYSLKYKNHENSVQIKLVYNSPRKETSENRIDLTIASNSDASTAKNIDLTINSNSPPPKKAKKIKKKNKNSKELKVKIKFKSESFIKRKEKRKLKLKLKPKVEASPVGMKQTILKFSPDYTSPKDLIVKPKSDVTPMKRKYVKHEKPTDSFKQMSIQSFFKVKAPDSQ